MHENRYCSVQNQLHIRFHCLRNIDCNFFTGRGQLQGANIDSQEQQINPELQIYCKRGTVKHRDSYWRGDCDRTGGRQRQAQCFVKFCPSTFKLTGPGEGAGPNSDQRSPGVNKCLSTNSVRPLSQRERPQMRRNCTKTVEILNIDTFGGGGGANAIS